MPSGVADLFCVQGDWDGFSDIDLLVVAANQDAAERAADQLIEALVGDDVLTIDQECWQAMAISPSPTGGRSAPRRSASIRSHEPGAADGLLPEGRWPHGDARA